MKQINAKITAKDLNVYYGDNHALKGVNLEIKERQVTSLIGPSGCGKSTFLKSLNRLIDLVPRVRFRARCTWGANLFSTVRWTYAAVEWAWSFKTQLSYEHLRQYCLRPKDSRRENRIELDEIVETSLKKAAIWDEVKDRLKKPALSLSGVNSSVSASPEHLCSPR